MTQYDLGRVVGNDGQQGAKGDDGNGIASIVKTGTSGKVDTYTITYTDGDTDTFTVTNGNDATVTIVTAWESTPSDSKVASEKLTKDTLDTKIAKSSTTGLIKNDGSIDTNTYLTSSAITGMLTTSDVVDNLTSTSATAPLSAKQGKVLNDLIGNAISYINGTGSGN